MKEFIEASDVCIYCNFFSLAKALKLRVDTYIFEVKATTIFIIKTCPNRRCTVEMSDNFEKVRRLKSFDECFLL